MEQSQDQLPDLIMYFGSQTDKLIDALQHNGQMQLLAVTLAMCSLMVAIIALVVAFKAFQYVRRCEAEASTRAFHDHRVSFFEALRRNPPHEVRRIQDSR